LNSRVVVISGRNFSISPLARRGGENAYRGGFISHYLVQLIYPRGLTRGIQIGLGLFVLLVAAVGYAGYLRRRPARQRGDGGLSPRPVRKK
jgi:hypothetical protein